MEDNFRHYSARRHRSDIQGIRAIGAILIMVYHIWLNKVSGGVDVFFVISGFFMGGVLLRQLAVDGKIKPFVFWGSIIKRVAPAAYTVLVVTLLLGYLFIPATLWENLVNGVVFSALHLENLHLMRTAVDYLARTEPPTAVQQFWALSIQFQFYAVLPFLFMVAGAIAMRLRSIYPVVLVLGGVLLWSFYYSVMVTAETPDSAYFNPLARLWEFLFGVMLAVAIPYIRPNMWLRQLAGLVGIVMLLSVGIVVSDGFQYPGYIALLPVLAAALLVVAGHDEQPSAVSKVLSNPYLVALGSLSFTIYLWHWPLLIVYLEYTASTSVGFIAGLAIIASSVLLAWVTHAYIEKPIKNVRRDQQRLWLSYAIGAVFFVPAISVSGGWRMHINALVDNHGGREVVYLESDAVGIQAEANTVPDVQFVTSKSDLPDSYLDSCHQQTANPEVAVCEYGDTASSVTIALVGGSHATQWLPALDRIGKSLGFKVLNITKSYCPFGALEGAHESCIEWNKNVVERLIEMEPTMVITNSTRAAFGGTGEYVPESYLAQWRALAEHSIPIIGIRDNPQFDFDVPHCIARNRDNALICSRPRSEVLSEHDPVKPFKGQLSNMSFVDMSEFFCTSEVCTTVYNSTLMYRDREHISVPYVTSLTPRLQEKLAEVAPEIFGGPGVYQERWAGC